MLITILHWENNFLPRFHFDSVSMVFSWENAWKSNYDEGPIIAEDVDFQNNIQESKL